MSPLELAKLRRAYGEIRQGYSVTRVGKDVVYIKHLSSIERGTIDAEFIKFYDSAVERGLSNEAARLKELETANEWTAKEELSIEDAKQYLRGLRETKSNLLIPSQLDGINKQIAENEEKLMELLNRRQSLLGFTAEEFASKKLNELYIFHSLFKSRSFDDLFVTEEDMEYMSDGELGRLIGIYNTAISELRVGTIKKIAIARFFQDLYSLCEKDIFKFYGTPVADLTDYQCDLAQYARFFYFIFSEHSAKPPIEIAEDPEKVIEWYNISKNAAQELEKRKQKGASGTENAQSLMGATKKDYEQLGMKVEGPTLSSLAAKNPEKKLNREQVMAFLNGQKV